MCLCEGLNKSSLDHSRSMTLIPSSWSCLFFCLWSSSSPSYSSSSKSCFFFFFLSLSWLWSSCVTYFFP